MAQIEKNTVKAVNQLEKKILVTFDNKEGKGTRVMFAGNSITRHGPKSDIGWYGDWGMAASSREKDYVHVFEKMFLEKDPDAAFCICQVADWEVHYLEGETQFPKFEEGRNFEADIIIVRLIENCSHKEFDKEIFEKEFEKLVDFLNKTRKAKIVVASGFWKHPGDAVLEALAKRRKFDFVYLGDLGEDSTMRADGLFEHSGVAAHPSDKGMEAIATVIFDKIKETL